MKTLPIIALLLPLTALNAQDHPDLFAYEGFDYPVDSSLEFKNGGTGWGAPWTWRNAIDGKGGVVMNSSIIDEGSLSYGDLETAGHHLHLYGDLGKLEMGRLLASVIPGDDGTSTYISFIAQRIGPKVDTTLTSPHWDDPATPEVEPYPYGDNLYPRGAAPVRLWNAINREAVAIGNFFQRQTDNWMAYGGGLLHYTDKPFSEAPSLVVVRLDHKGNDNPSDPDNNTADDLYMWVNPDLSQPEDLSAADLTIIAARDVNDERNVVDFSDIAWVSPFVDNPAGDFPHAEALLDELRIGRTWESVTPTGGGAPPPPTTWAGYSFTEDFDCDTGSFLGWLNLSDRPWIWSYSLQNWLYIEEDFVSPSGSWTYFLNLNP